MKKLSIYIAIIILLFGTLYFLNAQSKKANQDDSNPYGIAEGQLDPTTVNLLDDPNYQNIITPDKMEQKLDDKDTYMVYYFQSNCPHCEETTPIIMPMVKDQNIHLYQYNLLEFREGWAKYHIEATPTIVVYKDGKEVDRLFGGVRSDISPDGPPKEDFAKFFEKYKGMK